MADPVADLVIVDPAAGAVVDGSAPPAALGMPGLHVVRMVSALPVAGVEIVPARATERALELLGSGSATVVGNSGLYIPRLVWATRD